MVFDFWLLVSSLSDAVKAQDNNLSLVSDVVKAPDNNLVDFPLLFLTVRIDCGSHGQACAHIAKHLPFLFFLAGSLVRCTANQSNVALWLENMTVHCTQHSQQARSRCVLHTFQAHNLANR